MLDKLLEVEPSAFLANLCSRNVLNTVRDRAGVFILTMNCFIWKVGSIGVRVVAKVAFISNSILFRAGDAIGIEINASGTKSIFID